MDGRTDKQPQARAIRQPENIMPPVPVENEGIKIKSINVIKNQLCVVLLQYCSLNFCQYH